MTNKSRRPFFVSVAAALIAFATLFPVDAGARQGTGRFSGKRNGTLDREITRTPGQVEKSSAYTSPAGKVSTREATRTVDKPNGSVAQSSSTTLANGKTASSSFTSEKTDTGRTTAGERTGFNGKTSTYDSTRTTTETGFTRAATKTGPNGGTVEKELVVTKDNGTVTRTSATTSTPPPKP